MARNLVKTDKGEYLVQVSAHNEFGFSMCSIPSEGEKMQVFPGGVGVDGFWELANPDRAPEAIRAAFDLGTWPESRLVGEPEAEPEAGGAGPWDQGGETFHLSGDTSKGKTPGHLKIVENS